MKNVKRNLCFLMCVIVSVLFLSCKTTSSEKLCQLSGVIHLINNTGDLSLDPNDYAGIYVLLFDAGDSDAEMQNIHDQYPSIGVHHGVQTSFDHRNHFVMASSVTDQDGFFRMTNVNPGTYHVVILKNGWGYLYMLDTMIHQGENDLNFSYNNANVEMIANCMNDLQNSKTSGQEIALHPDLYFSGVMDNQRVIFSSLNHSVITDDMLILPSSAVVFEPGSVIRIEPHKKITIHGEAEIQGTPDSFFWVTSNDQAFSTNAASEIIPFDRITLADGCTLKDQQISNGMITHSDLGFSVNQGIDLINMLVSSKTTCVTFHGGMHNSYTIALTNCTFLTSEFATNYSVEFVSIGNAEIDKCIFLGNYGLYMTAVSTSELKNSYFSNPQTCISMHSDVNSIISNNEFVSEDIAIKAFLNSNYVFKYNNLYSMNIGLRLQSYYTNVTANYNNFFVDVSAIHSTSNSYLTLNARNNYWNATDAATIDGMIIDKNDFTPQTHPFYDTLPIVEYIPFRVSKVTNAGLR